MDRYAIIIGVEEYTEFRPTPFAHADAELIHQTLTESCDYTPQNSLLLKLSPDSSAQPSELLAKIRTTVANSKREDTILFYFAGHGHATENGTYLLLPTTVPGQFETTALNLRDVASELKCGDRVCFRVFDAFNPRQDSRNGHGSPDSNAFIKAVTHDPSARWITLAACNENQEALSDRELGHGVFTHHLSEYIRELKPDQEVLAESLNVGITSRVIDHAQRLGHSQTPTLNAPISGKVALAIRREDRTPEATSTQGTSQTDDLYSRILQLRGIPELNGAHLQELLTRLIDSVRSELKAKYAFAQPKMGVSDKLNASQIPLEMHEAVIDFVLQHGFQPRHLLRRLEGEAQNPAYISWSLWEPNKLVRYEIDQSSDLPKSAVVIEIAGDRRCVPTLKLLLYVLPLQVTACLLISMFRCDWPPHETKLIHVKDYYLSQQPDASPSNASRFASSAIRESMELLHGLVSQRVAQLERELARR